MLPLWFIYIAIVIRLMGGAEYVRSMFIRRPRANPNPITWFCWSLAPMLAAAAQWQAGVGLEAWMSFALGVGPLMVFVSSLIKGNNSAHFTKFNIACGVFALVGVVVWRLTSDPELAIIFCILADAFGGIPTVVKAYKNPKREPSLPFLMTMMSMIITILTIKHWTFMDAVFPIYIFLINCVIFTLTWTQIGKPRR